MAIDNEIKEYVDTKINNTQAIMNNNIRLMNDAVAKLEGNMTDINNTLKGNPEAGILAPFDRIHKAIEALPCDETLKRLREIENRQSYNNGVAHEKERQEFSFASVTRRQWVIFWGVIILVFGGTEKGIDFLTAHVFPGL